MTVVYIAFIAFFAFFFSIFLVVISEEIGIWAGVLFFAGICTVAWKLVKLSLSRY